MQAVVEARGDTPFADLADFAARVDPRQLNRMQLENLIRAGAFDSLEPNRARLFAAAETILRRAQAKAEEKESGQIGAVRRGAGRRPSRLRLPDMPDWPPTGAAGLRGRGDRLPPDRASARCLCAGAAPAGRDAVRAGRGARARPA